MADLANMAVSLLHSNRAVSDSVKYDIQNKQKIYEKNDTKSFKKYTKENKIRHNTKNFKGNVRR
jgi:hypothetical protein